MCRGVAEKLSPTDQNQYPSPTLTVKDLSVFHACVAHTLTA